MVPTEVWWPVKKFEVLMYLPLLFTELKSASFEALIDSLVQLCPIEIAY